MSNQVFENKMKAMKKDIPKPTSSQKFSDESKKKRRQAAPMPSPIKPKRKFKEASSYYQDNGTPIYEETGYSYKLKNEKEIYKKEHSIQKSKANYTEDEIAYEDELIKARRDRKHKEFEKKRNKAICIIMLIACVYVVFLIYGAYNTQYVYDDNGIAVPQKLSVTQLKNIKEFDKIATQYRQARLIYEDVLILDYRIGAGIEDPTVIAPEYEKVLEDIETLTLQLGGVQVSTEYTQLLNMLTTWVGTDIAVYCQNMSTAISYNNETNMSQALEYKEYTYNDFSLITKNLVTLGTQVDGVDISDIVDWSPESFINEESGGIY